jgi:hypothetical protein
MNKTLKRFLLVLFGGIGIYYVYNAISNKPQNEGEDEQGYEPYIPVPLDIDPDIDVPEEEIPEQEL